MQSDLNLYFVFLFHMLELPNKLLKGYWNSSIENIRILFKLEFCINCYFLFNIL